MTTKTKSVSSSNPTHIGQIDDSGRQSRYVGGVASPAVWYWAAKRGDKTMMRNLGLAGKDLARYAGHRVGSTGRLCAVCFVGDCYYEVSLCRAESMAA